MSSKIDKSIAKSDDFKRIVREVTGDVLKAHQLATYARVRRIKEFVERDLDIRVLRDGKPDAITHKHVVRVILGAVI